MKDSDPEEWKPNPRRVRGPHLLSQMIVQAAQRGATQRELSGLCSSGDRAGDLARVYKTEYGASHRATANVKGSAVLPHDMRQRNRTSLNNPGDFPIDHISIPDLVPISRHALVCHHSHHWPYSIPQSLYIPDHVLVNEAVFVRL